MKNNKKGYLTKFIKYESEKEYLDLVNAIEQNNHEQIVTIISKIYFDKRLLWN